MAEMHQANGAQIPRDLDYEHQKHRKPYSRQSFIPAYIIWHNQTKRNVSVYWINPKGKPVFVQVLKPGLRQPFNTFYGHPFEFRDRETDELMCHDHKSVFWPQPWNKDVTFSSRDGRLERKVIPIRQPIVALREAAMWQVARIQRTRANLMKLELPTTVLHDLNTAVDAIESKQRRVEEWA